MELYQVEQLHVEQKVLLETTRRYLQGAAQGQEIHIVEGEIFRMSGLLGIPIWKRGQEVVAREVAGDVESFYQEQAVPEDEGPLLCAQADGKGVRMVPAEQPASTDEPEPARRGKGEKPGHRFGYHPRDGIRLGSGNGFTWGKRARSSAVGTGDGLVPTGRPGRSRHRCLAANIDQARYRLKGRSEARAGKGYPVF